MIKNWKLLTKDERHHLSESHILNEYEWQRNLKLQNYWLSTLGVMRPCVQCRIIAGKVSQKHFLIVPDDISIKLGR